MHPSRLYETFVWSQLPWIEVEKETKKEDQVTKLLQSIETTTTSARLLHAVSVYRLQTGN